MKSKKPAGIAQKRRSPRPPIPRLTPVERRKRQLRRAAQRYRDKLRRRRTQGLGVRSRRTKPDRWALAPSNHDPRLCGTERGHIPPCPYFEETAAEDPEVAEAEVLRKRTRRRLKPMRPAPLPRDTRLDGLTALQRSRARVELEHLDDVAGCACLRCYEKRGSVRKSDWGVVGRNRMGESVRSWGDTGRRDDPSDDDFWIL